MKIQVQISWVGQSTTTAGNPGRIPACSWLVRQVCRRDQPLHLLLHVCRIQTGYWQYSTQVPSNWCVIYLKDARGEKLVWNISQGSDFGLQNLYFSISIVLLPQQPQTLSIINRTLCWTDCASWEGKVSRGEAARGLGRVSKHGNRSQNLKTFV